MYLRGIWHIRNAFIIIYYYLMFDLHARFHQKAVFDPYTYFFIFIVLYKTVIVLTQLCNCTGCVQHVSVLQLVFSGRQFPHKEFVSSSP